MVGRGVDRGDGVAVGDCATALGFAAQADRQKQIAIKNANTAVCLCC